MLEEERPPPPDPTILTTAQLWRAVTAERDLVNVNGFSLREVLEKYIQEHAHRHEMEREEVQRRAESVMKAVEIALNEVRERGELHVTNHLKEHLAHERIHDVEKQAADKSDKVLDRRLESVNEFRGQLADQASTFVTREVFEAQSDPMKKQLARIENRLAETEGKSAGTTAATGRMIAFVTTAVLLVNFAFFLLGTR